MGIVSTDEPRYADIGRAMARSGDWITPRLWGQPWFEKPALLYWMIAAGFKAGLGPELGPRAPVALMGLLFLPFFWLRLRTLWDARMATCSTAILGTSAGWLACSHVAITDIPLAVFFSAAVLFAMGERPRFTLAAACLGFATLAKSLPALIFFFPVLALDFRRWRSWLSPGPIAAFAVIAVPWHVLCTMQNGPGFLKVLFIEHQFGRFVSPALQHVQHWWYYLPVVPMLLFPWSPLIAVCFRDVRDPRIRIPGAVVLFGLCFLSASINKLATYPLPLLPSICILIGSGLAKTENAGRLTTLSVVLLGILPPAAIVLPVALADGLGSAQIPWLAFPLWLAAALAAGILISFFFRARSLYASALVAGICFLWFENAVFPEIDKVVSARPAWLAQQPVCVPPLLHRRLIYGLNYYAGKELPECEGDVRNPGVRYP